MAKVIGIDLGTTNSLAAYMKNGKPEVIPNAEGGRLTPSVVAFIKDGKRLVGQIAKRQAVANPERTIFSIKRRMGRRAYLAPEIVASIKRWMGSDHKVMIDDKTYAPEEISAMILQKVKADAESYLGERIEKAVITVPAYFNDSQRKATKDAGTVAGLDVIRIINEPTAASLAYGLDRENVHTILVWDLGGGTFDVSILELGEGVFEVKAVNGDTWLGGDDYDQRIVDYLAGELPKECGIDLQEDNIARQMLKEAAEKAKIELSTQPTTNVRVPFIYGDGFDHEDINVALTRVKFEELTEDLRQKMVGPTKQALADADLDPVDIDRVVLVGGSTRMPAVQKLAEDLIGLEPYRHINPDEVVTLGAAIQAGILMGEVREVVLIDVNPLSLGIETLGGIYSKIIPRNTPIPTSKGQIFTTARDNQTAVDVHALQGEREMAMYNMTLDRFRLSDIEPQPRGEARVEVTFDIDANSIVHASALDLQTDNKQRVKISSSSGLPAEEIKQMIEEARTHAEQDKSQREEVETGIRADSMICAAEHVIKESEEADRNRVRKQVHEVEKAILKVKEALASGDSEEIESKTEALEKVTKTLDEKTKQETRGLREWKDPPLKEA